MSEVELFSNTEMDDGDIEGIFMDTVDNHISIHINDSVTTSYVYLTHNEFEQMIESVKLARMKYLLTGE